MTIAIIAAVVVALVLLIAIQGAIDRAAIALERLADIAAGELNTRNMERAETEIQRTRPTSIQ
jgi:HAMP domain-containing protein